MPMNRLVEVVRVLFPDRGEMAWEDTGVVAVPPFSGEELRAAAVRLKSLPRGQIAHRRRLSRLSWRYVQKSSYK